MFVSLRWMTNIVALHFKVKSKVKNKWMQFRNVGNLFFIYFLISANVLTEMLVKNDGRHDMLA